jgi:hypothetical protein
LHFHVKAATGKQNGGQNNDKSASLPLKFYFGENSGSQKLSILLKKNPPIWKKIAKFGSREKTTYTVARE